MDERAGRTRGSSAGLRYILAAAVLLLGAAIILEAHALRDLSQRALETAAGTAEAGQAARVCSEEIEKLEHRLEVLSDLPGYTESARAEFFRAASELERRVDSGESELKIAYLTFDDGPYALTRDYLEVLDRYGVLATFFQRGRDWERFGEIYRLVKAGCHTMGNHTYSHKIRRGIYRSADAFMEDLLRNRDYLEEMIGVRSEVMRFPGGSSTAGRLKDEIIRRMRAEHYAYVDWNDATGDGMYDLTAEEYRDNVLNGTAGQKFLVVLMHDYNENTLKALPEIIEGLSAQGYIFLPLFYESLAVNR